MVSVGTRRQGNQIYLLPYNMFLYCHYCIRYVLRWAAHHTSPAREIPWNKQTTPLFLASQKSLYLVMMLVGPSFIYCSFSQQHLSWNWNTSRWTLFLSSFENFHVVKNSKQQASKQAKYNRIEAQVVLTWKYKIRTH